MWHNDPSQPFHLNLQSAQYLLSRASESERRDFAEASLQYMRCKDKWFAIGRDEDLTCLIGAHMRMVRYMDHFQKNYGDK